MPDFNVDTSFYPKPSQGGPASTMLGYLRLGLGMREFQGTQAVSDAIQAATGADGRVDVNLARQNLHDQGAYVPPESYAALLDLQQRQRDADKYLKDVVVTNMGRLLDKKNFTKMDVSRLATVTAEQMHNPEAGAMFNRFIMEAAGNGPWGGEQHRQNIQQYVNTATGGKQDYTTVQTALGPRSLPSGYVSVEAQKSADTEDTEDTGPPSVGAGADAGATVPPKAGTGAGGSDKREKKYSGPIGIQQEVGNDALWKAESIKMGTHDIRVQPLEQAIALMDRMPEGSTYPGAQEANRLKTFLQANMPESYKAVIDKLDASNPKDFAELQKNLTLWTNQNAAGGTDANRMYAALASPGVTLPMAASRDMARVALGIERRDQALRRQFADTGLSGSRFDAWVAKRRNELDPRAFVFAMMNKDRQMALLKTMPADSTDARVRADRQRFMLSLNLANRYKMDSPVSGWSTE